MGTPYLGEIRVVSFAFAPKGWALCNGQLLSISQSTALFSLLGTFYGGNGTTNFQLPNLQARMPVHMGNGFTQGQTGGEVNHTLILTELPSHDHQAQGAVTTASSASATGNTWAPSVQNPYGPTPNTTLNPATLGMA